MIVVFDIDGVLADPAHRLHHIEGRSRDWTRFFAEVEDDVVIDRARGMVRAMHQEGNYVILLTGRPARIRPATIRWLKKHRIPWDDLWMRSDWDRKPAEVYKLAELTRRNLLPADVSLIVDDSAAVVRNLAKAGYPSALWTEE